MSRRTVLVTESFAQNLEEVRLFLTEQQAVQAFDALVAQLFEQIVPTLQRFPDIGRDFLGRQPQSAEGLLRLDALGARIGQVATLREYVLRDYLVLYAVREREVILLSIRHHRQLSFDFGDHWEP